MQALMVETPVGSEGLWTRPESWSRMKWSHLPLSAPLTQLKGGSEVHLTRLSKGRLSG